MMKRFHSLLAVSSILIILASCVPIVKSFSKPNCNIKDRALGILPFYCTIPSVGMTISDTIGANLINSECRVIERSYLTSILEEHGIMLNGITESIDYSRIGKIGNVDYLLVGTVEAKERKHFAMFGHIAAGGESTEISSAAARIVDVRTGEVVLSVTYLKQDVQELPVKVGERLANAIKKELNGEQAPYHKNTVTPQKSPFYEQW